MPRSAKTGVDFLRDLDAKIRSTSVTEPDRFGIRTSVDSFTDRKLTNGELARVFEIVESEGLVLYPTTTTFGFHPAFEVFSATRAAPGVPPEFELLLKWRLDQSPEGWTWARMAEHFTKPEQLEFLGLPPIEDEAHYQY